MENFISTFSTFFTVNYEQLQKEWFMEADDIANHVDGRHDDEQIDEIGSLDKDNNIGKEVDHYHHKANTEKHGRACESDK